MSNSSPAPGYPPSAVPDSDVLRAKYAEIAALKKSIEEKRQKQYAHSQVPYWKSKVQKPRPIRNNLHRNMTLVFESGESPSTDSTSGTNVTHINSSNGDALPNANASPFENSHMKNDIAYVSTTNVGSMSLINSSIYEQEAKLRQRNFEAALSSKEAYRKNQLEKEFQRKLQMKRAKLEHCDRIRIADQTFAITHNGMILAIIKGSYINEHTTNESVVYWNDLPYVRCSNGDLICHVSRGRDMGIVDCVFFGSTGYCQKGSGCSFQHNPEYLRLCRSSMGKGCNDATCLLSHKPNQFNTPLCKYFLDNKCTMKRCPFLHRKPDSYDSPNVEISTCRSFSMSGYCKRGSKCPFLHLFVCPSFEEEGFCPRRPQCFLQHNITDSTQAKLLNNQSKVEEDNEVLVQSDNEDEMPGKVKIEKTYIDSYNTPPSILLSKGVDSKYSYYIDEGPSVKSGNYGAVYQHDDESRFMISIGSSDEESESDDDQLENNKDYIQIETERLTERQEVPFIRDSTESIKAPQSDKSVSEKEATSKVNDFETDSASHPVEELEF